MTYQEKLQDPRWNAIRKIILERDGHFCQTCGATNEELHVHHLYYIDGKNPWEYDDEALVTLCCNCHTIFHTKDALRAKIGSLSIHLLMESKRPKAKVDMPFHLNNISNLCTITARG